MREYALPIFPPCNPPFIYYQLLPEEEIYATCVMDIDEGDVIWVGKGRSIADFSKSFEETDKVWVKKR